MPRALVVGDVMTDIVVRPEGPIATGSDRRAAIRLLPGGSGANQACWLAREGVTVRFVARVGKDDRARETLLLAEHGVDARLGADETLPTGTLVTLVSPDGERSFLTDRAANLNLGAADLPLSLLDGVDFLHVSGYALFEPGPREAALTLVAEARRRLIPYSVDPVSYAFLEEVGPANFLDWIAGAEIVFPNAVEAETLTGAAEASAHLDRLTQLFPIVAIKRGPAGAIAGDAKGGRWSAPSVATGVVDTSGAGDAFFGGFLAAYLKSEGIDAALERGVARGTEAVAILGARPPLAQASAGFTDRPVAFDR